MYNESFSSKGQSNVKQASKTEGNQKQPHNKLIESGMQKVQVSGILIVNLQVVQFLKLDRIFTKMYAAKMSNTSFYTNALQKIKISITFSDQNSFVISIPSEKMKYRLKMQKFVVIRMNKIIGETDQQQSQLEIYLIDHNNKIKVLVAEKESIMQYFNLNSIKFYQIPSNNHTQKLTNYFYFNQITLLLSKIPSKEYQKIDYLGLCNYNGLNNCIAISYGTKVIIIRQEQVMDLFELKVWFQNQGCWVQLKNQNWVSFKNMGQTIAFIHQLEKLDQETKKILNENITTPLKPITKKHFDQQTKTPLIQKITKKHLFQQTTQKKIQFQTEKENRSIFSNFQSTEKMEQQYVQVPNQMLEQDEEIGQVNTKIEKINQNLMIEQKTQNLLGKKGKYQVRNQACIEKEIKQSQNIKAINLDKRLNSDENQLKYQRPIKSRLFLQKVSHITQLDKSSLAAITDSQLSLFNYTCNSSNSHILSTPLTPSSLFRHPKSSKILLTNDNFNIYTYDILKQQQQLTVKQTKNINDCKIMKSQDNLLVMSDKNILNFFDIRNGQKVVECVFRQGVTMGKLEDQGNCIIAGRDDGIIKIYDVRKIDGKRVRSINNFNLNQVDEQTLNSKMKKLQFTENNQSLFCQYNSTAYQIPTAKKLILQKTLMYKSRSFIKSYKIPSHAVQNMQTTYKNYNEDKICYAIHNKNIKCLYNQLLFGFDSNGKCELEEKLDISQGIYLGSCDGIILGFTKDGSVEFRRRKY